MNCHNHEAPLEPAFAGGGCPWQLICPYDVDGLDDQVIEEAERRHEFIAGDGGSRGDERDGYPHEPSRPFERALPQPPATVRELAFTGAQLGSLRRFLSQWAAEQALPADAADELVLAVNELATNSIRYGGGGGTLRTWRDGDSLVCEVLDEGHIQDPLIGRSRPAANEHTGRGLWLVNQLCDLVEIHSSPAGTVVRVHKSCAAGSAG